MKLTESHNRDSIASCFGDVGNPLEFWTEGCKACAWYEECVQETAREQAKARAKE